MREYAPRLKSDYTSKVRAILPHIRGRHLAELPMVAEEIKAASAGLAPATVNRRLALLRRVGNLASDVWGWVDEPIGRRVKLLGEANQRHVYLTPAQVEAVAAACTNPHAADLIRLAAYTGIRQGHMLRLTRHAVQGDAIELDTSSKTGQPLILPLHPRVQAVAERLPLPITANELRRQWEAARAAVGLPHVHWHDLRHTCASWYAQRDVPLLVIRDLLGHASMASTLRYAHLATKQLRDAVGRVP
jgi:integrase